MAAAAAVGGIYRGGGVVESGGAGAAAGGGQSRIGIMHHHFLAKGVDIALGAPGDSDAQRLHTLDAHGVAGGVSPQTVGCGDIHGIHRARLHTPGGHRLCRRVVDRDKLVKHAGVEQQLHRRRALDIGHGKKSLRGIVCLKVAHTRRVGDGAVLLAVWPEGDATVEKHLQMWPYIVDGRCAGSAYHLAQHGEKPRGHARDIGDILAERRLHQRRQLAAPIGHEGHLA